MKEELTNILVLMLTHPDLEVLMFANDDVSTGTFMWNQCSSMSAKIEPVYLKGEQYHFGREDILDKLYTNYIQVDIDNINTSANNIYNEYVANGNIKDYIVVYLGN